MRSSCTLVCRRPSWAVMAWIGTSSHWCCPCRIFFCQSQCHSVFERPLWHVTCSNHVRWRGWEGGCWNHHAFPSVFVIKEYLAGLNKQEIFKILLERLLCFRLVTFFFSFSQEYLAGVSRQKTSKSLGDSFKLFWLRFFTNFVVLALLGGAGYLVYFLSQEQESFSSKAGCFGLVSWLCCE